MSKPEKTAVRFTKPAPPYLTGDVAAFPPGQAQSLIARGLAEKHGDAEPPAKREPKGAPAKADP